LWQIKSPLQKQYDLWHGIPLKNVLCMGEEGIKEQRQASNVTKRFATSSLTKALLSASFDYNALKIDITGQPRTDALFKTNNSLKDLLNEDIGSFSKVVIYMPTYRQGYNNKSEGNKFSSDNIFRMAEYNHIEFLKFLKKENILFLLKLHPFEEKLYQNINLGGNIRWITNLLMLDCGVNIYDIIPHTDILITDYSSIYFDYLLLDHPIIFMPLDLNYYQQNRGFELEPYDFWTPGTKVFNQVSLQEQLLLSDTKQASTIRKTVRDIMFAYQDGNSSQRVLQSITKEMGL
jgi:CDP-glycerol glycerophosphotransferase (TagB/SpsB family)